MTDRSTRLTQESSPAGDAAVDGLFAGIVSGVVMAVYLVVAGMIRGEAPGAMLARFAASEATWPLVGALSHLAVSAVYGTLFGLGWWLLLRRRRNGVPVVVAGLIYGALLLIAARFIILPATNSPLREIPFAHWALAHGIYGLALGLMMSRGQEA